MGELRLQRTKTGVRFAVRVQPRASRTELAGVHGDALKVRVRAEPADGAANEALIILLARAFAIRVRDITIVSGASSRMKVVELDGVTEDRVKRLVKT